MTISGVASSPAPFSVPRAAPATVRARWSAYVEETVSGARAAGEIAEDTDVPQLAFEIATLLEPANTPSVPHNEFSSPQPLSGDRAHVPAGTCAAALLPPAPAYADTPTAPAAVRERGPSDARQDSVSTASISRRKSFRSSGVREVISGQPPSSSRTTDLSTQEAPALVRSVLREAYDVRVLPWT